MCRAMKKLAFVIALLLAFAFIMVLFSYKLSDAEEYPSLRDSIYKVEGGMTEEFGPEEPLPPFA